MKNRFSELKRLSREKLKGSCDRIPEKKRRRVVLGMCVLFTLLFAFALWDSFRDAKVKDLFQIEHITPLDLPQDSIINHLKDLTDGQKE
ncbi:TraL conjugative transposon family protein [Draconibacterium sp. IB214405]|uniref:TraL conjugative transposon family protein n=1 Tax=Draconibacterium sp. IB214405 TaxID=3097352 RepID=UPI002A10ADAE|nr:TraL conjugative transposon family protein [Draconibacterium sp. IB214405]MDX8341673.1 TraL conjugative transposon family protein [Draconibacterium sp. IB214405]